MPAGTKNDIVDGVIRAEVLWNQGGLPAANILHVGYSGGAPIATDCLEVSGAITGALAATLLADMPTTTVLVGCTSTDLGSLTGATATNTVGLAGTGGSSELPASACVLVDWLISRRYRGGHPRTYWPGADAGSLMTPSAWNTDIATDWSTCMTALLAAVTGIETGAITLNGLVNVSYVDADAWRVTNVVDPITGFRVSGLVRSQRRRLTSTAY